MKNADFKSYALLGSGRVARHLLFYLESLNLPVQTWARRNDPPERLREAVEASSHILFAVKDDAVAELSRPFLSSGKTLVHFSGALQLEGVFAAHPLMTFGQQFEDLDWYPLIPFVLDFGTSLQQLLPGLPNRGWNLDPRHRPLYHALAALAGNSAFLLWNNIGDEFERTLKLPRGLLQPFLHQAVTNSALGAVPNFTGPVARGDWETVKKHLAALSQRPDLLAAYRGYLQLARESGHSIPEALV